MLIIRGKKKSTSWLRETEHMTMAMPSIGIPSVSPRMSNLRFCLHSLFLEFLMGPFQLVEVVRKGKQKYKMDKRMTGSSIIDDVLQEVCCFSLVTL